MRNKIFFAAAVFFVSSCGDDKKDFAGALGTCTMTMPLLGEICSEYVYSATKQKDDPKGSAQTQMETSCQASSGTWSATGTCSTTNLVGTCSTSSTSGDASVTAKAFYYSSESVTADIVQASCSQSGGTFAAP